MERIKFLVIIVSDSCYDKTATDTSGFRLAELLATRFANAIIYQELVPDDRERIEEVLIKYCDTDFENHVQAIFTTGGTGFSPRDITPEVTKSVIQKECPGITIAMFLESAKKTPYAALSRAVCGIRNNTLIINFPGSEKAVIECFTAIKAVLPHALELIQDNKESVKVEHAKVQGIHHREHKCTHGLDPTHDGARASQYKMLPLAEALQLMFDNITRNKELIDFLNNFKSLVDVPPFMASIKDGYAMKSTGFSGVKKVIGYVSAGEDCVFPLTYIRDDECYKINTGAPLPPQTDCVVPIEQTTLLRTKKDGTEDLVQIMKDPAQFSDVRLPGSDLQVGAKLFATEDMRDVVVRSLMAHIGNDYHMPKPRIAIISTGNELCKPGTAAGDGKIFDSNTTMIEELLKYFGFNCDKSVILNDDFETIKKEITQLTSAVDFIICTGGVSMGDKDYIKPVIKDLQFDIKFGRVQMKPGLPMTFASNGKTHFFGLPGNPVSAFVCFHVFVLPALKWATGYSYDKCQLATITVTIQNEQIELDPRPEFMRATICSKGGKFFAEVIGEQSSSRLQSIVGADVLLHLPGRTNERPSIREGEEITASILRHDFISKYE